MNRHLLNLLLMISLAAMASGQPASNQRQAFTYPPYKQYTLRDGLPQMQITCLFQDSRGYLWVGTKGGISSTSPARKVLPMILSMTSPKIPWEIYGSALQRG